MTARAERVRAVSLPAGGLAGKWPWMEPPGRFSPLKAVVFASLFLPGLWAIYSYSMGMLGARPLTEVIHQTGLWTLRFFLMALAVTPVRQMLQWPHLLLVRRMIGVAACAYGIVHLVLYAADEKFALSTVASEIVLRIYLTIGFTALIGLAVLAATSTDGMVYRLGSRRWQRLHRLAYGIGVLAIIHYFMQSKADVWEATWIAGLFAWLMGYRLIATFYGRGRRVPLWSAAALGIAVALLTAFGEAVYYWFKIGASPERVLVFNLSFSTGFRPAWIVLAGSLAISAAGLIGALTRRKARLPA